MFMKCLRSPCILTKATGGYICGCGRPSNLILEFVVFILLFPWIDYVRQNINQAMVQWEKFTCIKFVNRTDEADYVIFNPGPCGYVISGIRRA